MNPVHLSVKERMNEINQSFGMSCVRVKKFNNNDDN